MKAFEGFRFVNGKLWTPDRYSYIAGDIRAFYWKNQLLHEHTTADRAKRIKKRVQQGVGKSCQIIQFKDYK